MRILVADDDTHLRQIIAHMLRELGHEVTEAKSGREAFFRISEIAFNAVITDMRMPPESGLTVLQALWRSDVVPVYVHSSENTFSDPRNNVSLTDLQTEIPHIFGFAVFHLKDRDDAVMKQKILDFIRDCESKAIAL